MESIFKLVCTLCLVAFNAYAAGDTVGDPVHGLTLYQSRCASCHSMDYNGTGPAHKGVFGRKAGSAPGYLYSAAVKASHIVWTEKTLDRWLKNPEKFIPRQKMGIRVDDAQDRADLIAYLKQESSK